MALFIRQNEDRSKLQERLAAELQERSKQKAKQSGLIDGVTDSEYIKDTKQTTSLAWVWILIVLLAVTAFVWLTILNTTK
jgi:type VI protein secretion system component VasF